MTYNYRADVTMSVNVDIQAESYEVAEGMVQQLAVDSDDKRMTINSTDQIDLSYIESDDDPTEEGS